MQLHREKQFPEAAKLYNQCLALQPQNFEARSNLGAVMAQLGRFQDAIDSYRQALASAPPEAANALRRNLALAFYKSGQIPEAVAELARIHAAEPADRQTLLLLADCYLLTGDPGKTVELLQSLGGSEDPAVDYLLGTALIRSGDLARGKPVIDRILRRSDSAEAHLLLGAGMFEARNYPSAAAEFSRAININPELPLANSYYGQALLTTGDAEGAANAFRGELALNPNDFEANLGLGQILTARHRSQEALPLLRRAALIRPASAPAHQSLAQAYQGAGRLDDAKTERQWLDSHGFKPNESTIAESTIVNGPASGSLAPDFSLVRHDFLRHGSSERVQLSQFRGKSPVLLVFASYSCPQFRAQVAKLNSLYQRYGKRIPFLLVYIREAHAGEGWQSSINRRDGIEVPEAKTAVQKQANADLCLRKLKIFFSAAIDDLTGSAEKAYAAWPSRVFLVNTQGRIAFQTHLDEQEFSAGALERALERTLHSSLP
ncbi:MAG: tetratricopeptide repeat protein [Acidobacteriota bacterium]|nr:tetratricopeptide repeat protein [Acidobacteriota bacterium]